MAKSRKRRVSSRLQKIEDRQNTQQAALFIALSMGFLGILLIIGLPAMEKLIIWMGNRNTNIEQGKNDNIPPIPPRLITEYEATNSATINITGYSEADSKVVLYVNINKAAEIVTDEEGEFEFHDVHLMGGDNNIYAIATDLADNESEKSVNTVVEFDNEAPEINITAPNDGAKYFDEENEIIVGGTTDPDANLRINGYIVIVDGEGNYAKRIRLNNGDNKIEIKAYDEAGNETIKEISVHYQD